MSLDASRLNPSNLNRRLNGKNKWLVRLMLLALLAVGGLIVHRQLFAPRFADRRLPTVPTVKSNLPITLSANAIVKPEQAVNISPKMAGILKKLLVSEGDKVKEGQIIAYMDDSNLQGQLLEAKGKLATAQAKLQKLEAGNRPQEIQQTRAKLEQAQAKWRQTELTLSEDKNLFKTGAISQRNLENSSSERDSAWAQVKEAQQALSLMQAGSRVEEIAQARAEKESAQGTLQNVRAQMNDTVIRAPFSGTITRKFTDPGGFVTPSTAASAEFSATSSSILALASRNRVVADVAETNIAKIKIGQAVIIKADAYPGKIFSGKVAEIAPQSTVQMNVTTFEVKVALTDPEGLLRAGMNTKVEFQVGQLENALVVPTVAIVREKKGTGVYVPRENQPPLFKTVQTGITVGSVTEVESGLAEGEEVLIGMPKTDQSEKSSSSILQGPPPAGPPSGGGGAHP